MGLGDNTTINEFWKTAIIVKIATVAIGLSVLAFDPSVCCFFNVDLTFEVLHC
jgi:hypothetical protein